MNNLIPIEIHEQRVLLTSQLAEEYETNADVISKNYKRNQDHYQEGKHFYCLEGEEKREFLNRGQFDGGLKNAAKLYLWTEKGAFLHAKSLNTDRAWEVYDELVDGYFKAREVATKKLTAMDMLRLQSAALEELDDRVSTVEDKLENQMTIDHAKQRTLQNVIAQKVYQRIRANILTGDETNIRECSSRYFKSIYRDLKNRFGVASYRDIKMSEYNLATAYVSAWIEPASVRKDVA